MAVAIRGTYPPILIQNNRGPTQSLPITSAASLPRRLTKLGQIFCSPVRKGSWMVPAPVRNAEGSVDIGRDQSVYSVIRMANLASRETRRRFVMVSVRAMLLVLIGSLLGACEPAAGLPQRHPSPVTPRATTAPSSSLTIDALMHCPTPDAALTAFPQSAQDGARTLAVPELFWSSLRFIQLLSPGGPKPCDGIDPERVVAARPKGKMRWALLGKVVKPLPLWRAFSANGGVQCNGKPQAGREGNWWSAVDPRESGKDAYRDGAAICRSWNDLGKVVHCTVKPGAVIAIGPAQALENCECPVSPKAAPESYAATDQWQVYVNLYGQEMSDIMDCATPVDW